jgi:hypothetical protein
MDNVGGIYTKRSSFVGSRVVIASDAFPDSVALYLLRLLIALYAFLSVLNEGAGN